MFTREEWAIALLHKLGNTNPHPYIVKFLVAWGQFETANPEHYAMHNLLNTTEPGYGDNLLPHWNEGGVRQYPTFEDGIAANAAALIGGPNFYYPTLLDCLRLNQGQALIDATLDIAHELETWGTGHASDIAALASSKNLRMAEAFPGRHAGHP